jgi:hypothetical protein
LLSNFADVISLLMRTQSAKAFSARIEIIGVNPFVFVPEQVLESLFEQAIKHKGKMPVKMKIDGHAFIQTLVKYSGHWRLYLNLPMRKAAGKEVGDVAVFEVEYDTEERKISIHPKLAAALKKNKQAAKVFHRLSPSLQLEINRYFSHLKTEASVDKNIPRAINFLLGKERFVGRDPVELKRK